MKDLTEIKQAYLATFGTPRGQLVLKDLERIINSTRVTADAPNPYSAIYKVSQQALIQRINNMMEKETPKTKLGGK
jgi:ATP sulfurylase|tara:strand:+ start:140 stop:367 length:228 start_codon:yes stop_codon:yes gene_type:complete